MTLRAVQFNMPVIVRWDDTRSNQVDAVADWYRILEEAEQAGFMDRNIIDVTYGTADKFEELRPGIDVTFGDEDFMDDDEEETV